MALPTAEEITDWYLYDQKLPPADLLDETLLRAATNAANADDWRAVA